MSIASVNLELTVQDYLDYKDLPVKTKNLCIKMINSHLRQVSESSHIRIALQSMLRSDT